MLVKGATGNVTLDSISFPYFANKVYLSDIRINYLQNTDSRAPFLLAWINFNPSMDN